MKTIYTPGYWLAPIVAGLALFVSAETSAATTAAPAVPQSETAFDRGDKGKDEIKKPQKRKKIKQKRTNHGPRKPLFPQVHRREEALNRATYRNPYESKRK